MEGGLWMKKEWNVNRQKKGEMANEMRCNLITNSPYSTFPRFSFASEC